MLLEDGGIFPYKFVLFVVTAKTTSWVVEDARSRMQGGRKKIVNAFISVVIWSIWRDKIAGFNSVFALLQRVIDPDTRQ